MTKHFKSGLGVPWTVIVATMLPLLVIAHLTLLFSSRAHPTVDAHEQPYRVVLMSDTHVIGPQYVPGTESNPVDNESILKTPRRLREVWVPAYPTSQHMHIPQVAALVNAIHPNPDLAVFVGDVVHNALDASTNYSWFLHHRNALTVASDLFKRFTLPVHFMWGAQKLETILPTSITLPIGALLHTDHPYTIHTTPLPPRVSQCRQPRLQDSMWRHLCFCCPRCQPQAFSYLF